MMNKQKLIDKLIGNIDLIPVEKIKLELSIRFDYFKFLLKVVKFELSTFDCVFDVSEVMSVMTCSYFSKVGWMLKPNVNLNGLTPLQSLKFGLRNAVLNEARNFEELNKHGR